MTFDVRLSDSAKKELARLPKKLVARLLQHVGELRNDPRPSGCLKLRGEQDLWRVRVGDYRIIYGIDDDRRRILVMAVAHRSDAY